MSIKNGKKLGFFASIAMMVGTVVGIGIFLKNHSILDANSWSGTGTLVSWIIGGVLSLAAAISFSEIASFKTKTVDGLPAWSEKIVGKKLGYFVRFNYPLFYFAMLMLAISFFASETVISIFVSLIPGAVMPHLAVIVVVGLGLMVFFITLNLISVHAGGTIAQVTVVLKFIPLILVGVLGIAMATTNHNAGGVAGASPALVGKNAFTNGVPFKFTNMLAALPAVLFAFDAFLNVGSLRHKMKNQDQLPKVVLFGMIATVTLYLLIAISAILHGSGMVSGKAVGAPASLGLGIFDQIFSSGVAKGMGIFVIVFIAISTIGVTNGLAAVLIATTEQAFVTRTVFGMERLAKKFGERKGLIIFLAILLTLWGLVVGVPAIATNSDAFIDGISNFPTLFFFAIYGFVILKYMMKRSTFETKKINNVLFYSMASIAVVGITFVVGYQFFYGMSVNLLMHANDASSAGLFATTQKLLNWQLFATFIGMLIVFTGVPLLNSLLIEKYENRQVSVSTQL